MQRQLWQSWGTQEVLRDAIVTFITIFTDHEPSEHSARNEVSAKWRPC